MINRLSRSLRFGILVAALGACATAVISGQLVASERRAGLEDLERRAGILAFRLAPAAARAAALPDDQARAALGDRLEGQSRLLGFALCRADGSVIAAGRNLPDLDAPLRDTIARAAASRTEQTAVSRGPTGPTHLLALPLNPSGPNPVDAPDRAAETSADGTGVVLAVFHDAIYLDERVTRGMLRAVIWSLAVGTVLFLFTAGGAWAFFERPLYSLAEWMRRLRFGNATEAPPRNLAVSRLTDESEHLAASLRAARSREREEAHEMLRTERAWTRERLRAHAIDALGGQQLVVISNREPYMHQMQNGHPHLVQPASGLVTALDPVLRACGGLWVAHGAGDADRQTADSSGCIAVPPGDPRYTLRRVWISKEMEQGYYYGFSNEGLWPLCHLTHERPTFRAADWDHYTAANRRFADAALQEIGDQPAVVMVQDYQLALVPAMIKQKRPDVRVGIFWHIPWPNPEAFRICPYRVEILKGMLGADLIGFHLQQHCNNFLEAVDRMVEARLDWDRFSADVKGHTTLVQPFPISVQAWSEKSVASGEALTDQIARLKRQLNLEPGAKGDLKIGVGVDRIDYTKGIAERFRAIDRFFEKRPEFKGAFTFVQLGAPSRTHIPRYRDLVNEIESMADAINWKHRTDTGAPGWQPIVCLVGHHDAHTVYAFMRMADTCLVSSLHDGMNLVAKEYVACHAGHADRTPPRADPGVLILSEFAGAARDLPEALIINPYDAEEFADAIHTALTMPADERARRMTAMRARVDENNIYRWAAKFLAALAKAHKQPAPVRAPSPLQTQTADAQT